MDIGSFDHKGFKRLYLEDDASKIEAATADKLRLMLAFLEAIASTAELLGPPKWKAHQLSGDRKGSWSLFVTKNWRLTFREDADGTLQDLNLEDYH